jgi:uncharacterized Zn finger protein
MYKEINATYKCRGCGADFVRKVKDHELPNQSFVRVWMKANMTEFHKCVTLPSVEIHGVGDLRNVTVIEK